jgi:ADP-ribose pyrophosphatase
MESSHVLTSTQAFRGPVFAVRTDRVRLSDGHEARMDVVEHAGSVGIVACPQPGELVLVRQYRHAVGRSLWEIPAGSMDAGESPAAAALRELAEETGYRGASAREIASIYPTPGYCSELLHVMHVEGVSPGTQSLDEDERIEVAVMPIARLRDMAASGEIGDAKTLLALLWFCAGVPLLP